MFSVITILEMPPSTMRKCLWQCSSMQVQRLPKNRHTPWPQVYLRFSDLSIILCTNLAYTTVLYQIVSCQAFCCDRSGIHSVNRGKLVLHICIGQESTIAVSSVRTT